MTTTTPKAPVGALPTPSGRRNGALLVLALVGCMLLAGAAVATLNRQRTEGQPAAARSLTTSAPNSALVPGGSVYDEQVPTAARSLTTSAPNSALVPGGSVYDEQVPTAARSLTTSAPNSALVPGGSVR
jgi:hypothetical protein